MPIGSKVRHESGSFIFEGTIIGEIKTSSGRRLYAIEQTGTAYVQLFGVERLRPVEVKLDVKSTDWFDKIPEPQPPPPKPEFPIKLFVPVTPVPRQAARYPGFKSQVRLNYLPTRPPISLRTEKVKAEVEFHFTNNAVGDLDNLTKPVLDLLCGSIIHDDNQVMELSVKYVVPSKQSGFSVTLTPYAPQG